jgi:serine/threonine protein kinase
MYSLRYNAVPEVIGHGAFGCVHKPSLKCEENGVDYNDKISKYMDENNAKKEMDEYKKIQSIDRDGNYYLGVPHMCKVNKTDKNNLDAIYECNDGKGIELLEIDNFDTLLVMKDGGMNLKKFAEKYKTKKKTPENQRQMELFWIECHRLFMGIKRFLEEDFIHHDLKPHNIMYDETENRVNFIDFGKSKNRNEMISQYQTTDSMEQQFWWNYLPETGFYNKNVYMDFFDDTVIDTNKKNEKITKRVHWFEKFINDYGKKQTIETIAFKNLFGFIDDKKNPKINEKNIIMKFVKDLRHFVLDETYNQTNHEQFLIDSTATIDVYGLGLSLIYVLTHTHHLIDDDLFDGMYDIFYNMMNANLLTRYRIDFSMTKYENVLEKCGLLQKYEKHFENNELVNNTREENILNNKINELANIPIVVDQSIIDSNEEINTHLLKSQSPTKGGKRWLKSRKSKSKSKSKSKKSKK